MKEWKRCTCNGGKNYVHVQYRSISIINRLTLSLSNEFNTSRPTTDDLEANPMILTDTRDNSGLTLLNVIYLKGRVAGNRERENKTPYKHIPISVAQNFCEQPIKFYTFWLNRRIKFWHFLKICRYFGSQTKF